MQEEVDYLSSRQSVYMANQPAQRQRAYPRYAPVRSLHARSRILGGDSASIATCEEPDALGQGRGRTSIDFAHPRDRDRFEDVEDHSLRFARHRGGEPIVQEPHPSSHTHPRDLHRASDATPVYGGLPLSLRDEKRIHHVLPAESPVPSTVAPSITYSDSGSYLHPLTSDRCLGFSETGGPQSHKASSQLADSVRGSDSSRPCSSSRKAAYPPSQSSYDIIRAPLEHSMDRLAIDRPLPPSNYASSQITAPTSVCKTQRLTSFFVRPGYGEQGRPVEIQSNFFAVRTLGKGKAKII